MYLNDYVTFPVIASVKDIWQDMSREFQKGYTIFLYSFRSENSNFCNITAFAFLLLRLSLRR